MATHHSVESSFQNTHIVKLESGCYSDTFRPSAIDLDYGAACTKASMEALEQSFCNNPCIISSAAHSDLSIAIDNARLEAIERISLSAWWAFDRPLIGRLSRHDSDAIVRGVLPDDESFNVSIGFVEPSCGTGYAAVSILESVNNLPRLVLGGSYHRDSIVAAKKAFLESLQSWVATNWLKDNDRVNMPYWDIQGLDKRKGEVQHVDVVGVNNTFHELLFENYFDDKIMNIIDHNGYYIVGIDIGKPVNGLTHLVADLDRRAGEYTKVFTQHNF